MRAPFDRLRLASGRRVRLRDWDPGDTSLWPRGKQKADDALAQLREEMDRLQELLYADGRHALLVVLQGMDTSGKDGVIRHVFEGVNPQGVRVSRFNVPTPEERAHDFLWRIHRQAPAKGEIAIFNRSQYEDILAARVHGLVPQKVWSTRFATINGFERELCDEGVVLLKFFLHISPEEQRRRLQERIDDPTKRWKLSASDLAERGFWGEYQHAYEDMLGRTSSRWAPWYVVPSDHKWFSHLVISSVMVETLRRIDLSYPKPAIDVRSLRVGPVKAGSHGRAA